MAVTTPIMWCGRTYDANSQLARSVIIDDWVSIMLGRRDGKRGGKRNTQPSALVGHMLELNADGEARWFVWYLAAWCYLVPSTSTDVTWTSPSWEVVPVR